MSNLYHTTHKVTKANRTLAKNGRRKWTYQPLEEVMEMVERGNHKITSISSPTNHLNGCTMNKKVWSNALLRVEEDATIINWILVMQEVKSFITP
jgi:hypothetical protein